MERLQNSFSDVCMDFLSSTQLITHTIIWQCFYWNDSDARLTIFWGEFIVGVFVDVVASDSDIDAVGERPIPLHVTFVHRDQPLEDLEGGCTSSDGVCNKYFVLRLMQAKYSFIYNYILIGEEVYIINNFF